MEKQTKKKIIKYSVLFILFSFIGALLEYLFTLIVGVPISYYWRSLYLLTGLKIPFIPFYGGIFLLLIFIQRLLQSKKVPFILWGGINAFLIIIYEFIFGLLGFKTFKVLIWDYTSHIPNMMGIISLNMSILWILAGYLFSIIYLIINQKIVKLKYL